MRTEALTELSELGAHVDELRLLLGELQPASGKIKKFELKSALIQELGLEEIAQITGVGRETVKSRLRYAMDKLRARLGS